MYVAGVFAAAGSHFGVIGSPPPYALDTPSFRFRALAALAGRTTLGDDREVVLGCFMAARLAAGCLEPAIPALARDARCVAARAWYAALALPASTRVPFARLVDATAGEARSTVAEALRNLLAAVERFLDAPSRLEIERLAGALAGDA